MIDLSNAKFVDRGARNIELLEAILAELKKLNAKEELDDFKFIFNGKEETIKYCDILEITYDVNEKYYADVHLISGLIFYLKGIEASRFLKWFEEQKQKAINK